MSSHTDISGHHIQPIQCTEDANSTRHDPVLLYTAKNEPHCLCKPLPFHSISSTCIVWRCHRLPSIFFPSVLSFHFHLFLPPTMQTFKMSNVEAATATFEKQIKLALGAVIDPSMIQNFIVSWTKWFFFTLPFFFFLKKKKNDYRYGTPCYVSV